MMNAHRINIPDAKPPTIAQQAGQLAIDAIREAGMDPRKAAEHPMVCQMLQMWCRGEWTRAQVVHALGNMLILNPGLAQENR